jgi:hypothetical protein
MPTTRCDQRRRPAKRVVGWLNRKTFEETGDEAKSQGWSALILDTNGNAAHEGPSSRTSRSIRQTRRRALYGIGIIRSTARGVRARPGTLVRSIRANPPATTLAEVTRCPRPALARAAGDTTAAASMDPAVERHMAADRRK